MAEVKQKNDPIQASETTDAAVFTSKTGIKIPRKSDYKPGALKLGIDKSILSANNDLEFRWVNEGEDGISGLHEAENQGWVKADAALLKGASIVRQATGAEKCHLMLKPKEDYEAHRKIKMQAAGLMQSGEEKTIPEIKADSFLEDNGMTTSVVRKGSTVITDSSQY